MVNLKLHNYSIVDINIDVPGDAHMEEAFEALYRAWLAAGYLDEQFDEMCGKYGKYGDMMFVSIQD